MYSPAYHGLDKFLLSMAFTCYFFPLYSPVTLRAVALVVLLGFTWLLANSVLGGDGNSLIRMLFSGKDVIHDIGFPWPMLLS